MDVRHKIKWIVASLLFYHIFIQKALVTKLWTLSTEVQQRSFYMTHYRLQTNNSRFHNLEEYPILYWRPMGRFGNLFFQYSFMYCTARVYKRTPVILHDSLLLTMFSNITAYRVDLEDVTGLPDELKVQGTGAKYVPDTFAQVGVSNKTWIMGYFMSFKYFEQCEEDLRREFTISATIKEQVNNDLYQMALPFIKEHNISLHDVSFVGLHVRLGDRTMEKYLIKDKGPAPLSYIKNAIEYCNKKYKWPLFIVASEGIDWCKQNIISSRNNVMFSDYKAEMFEYDFALLTSCNHTIITIGTFGWFAAWLTNGDVIYYDKWRENRFNPDDYYLPEWIPLE